MRLTKIVFAAWFAMATMTAIPLQADSVMTQWNAAALQAVRTSKLTPPIVARLLAVTHTCMYDAWCMYDPTSTGTAEVKFMCKTTGSVQDQECAVCIAAYRALTDLFPQTANVINFQTLLHSEGFDETQIASNPAAEMGAECAEAVISFRHLDGSNQLGDLNLGAYSDYTGFTPENSADLLTDPSFWQPLKLPLGDGLFTVQKCVTPQWPKVKPFALTAASELRPKPPQWYPGSGYAKQAKQLLQYSAKLDDKRKAIAEYWGDGPASETPPGHWCVLAQAVSHEHSYGLDDDVKMFFALTNSLMDASIAAWDCKMFYDSVRPITSIRYLYAGQFLQAWGGPGSGTTWIRGEDWLPYQKSAAITPAFPEYVSGHSTFSAAAAQVLSSFTGSNKFDYTAVVKAGSSQIEPGITPAKDVTLHFSTFTSAAIQAGLSRRYGGIHFIQADLEGRRLGKSVGQTVWAKAVKLFNPN